MEKKISIDKNVPVKIRAIILVLIIVYKVCNKLEFSVFILPQVRSFGQNNVIGYYASAFAIVITI